MKTVQIASEIAPEGAGVLYATGLTILVAYLRNSISPKKWWGNG